jgi:hypothetical protein
MVNFKHNKLDKWIIVSSIYFIQTYKYNKIKDLYELFEYNHLTISLPKHIHLNKSLLFVSQNKKILIYNLDDDLKINNDIYYNCEFSYIRFIEPNYLMLTNTENVIYFLNFTNFNLIFTLLGHNDIIYDYIYNTDVLITCSKVFFFINRRIKPSKYGI